MAQLVKKSACNVGDLDLILRLEIYPGEGKGYLLQYSSLENSRDYTVHGIFQARALEWGAIAFSNVHLYLLLYTIEFKLA